MVEARSDQGADLGLSGVRLTAEGEPEGTTGEHEVFDGDDAAHRSDFGEADDPGTTRQVAQGIHRAGDLTDDNVAFAFDDHDWIVENNFAAALDA